MVIVFKGKEKHYMDGFLQTNLDTAKKKIEEDWDMVFIVDGMERSGKSTIAMQIAHYCDPTLTIDRIVFTPKELRKAIIDSEPFQAIVYDEAYTGLSSRATMSLINRTLVTMMAEIGQKNLFILVVMPCFFDLDKYIALFRSRVLIHVYTKNFQRGYFNFYNVDRKKTLYMFGKKYYNYSKPKPNFRGRFTNHYVVDEIKYRYKKRHSLIDREKKQEEEEKYREIQNQLFDRLMHLDKIPHSIRMQILSMPQSTYFNKLKQWKEQDQLDDI